MIRIYNKNFFLSSSSSASSASFVLAFETIQSKEKWTDKILDAIHCCARNGNGDDAIPFSRYTSSKVSEDHDYFESDKPSKTLSKATSTSTKKTIYKEGWMQKLGAQNKSWKKRLKNISC
jgi:hypothetical protein